MDPEPGSWYNLFFLLDTHPVGDVLLALPWGQLILFILLLSISFLVSGSEVAFLSLSHTEEEQLKSEDSPAGNRVLEMIRTRESRNKLLATILITNNFVNVAAILVASSLLAELAKGLELNSFLLDLINVVLITGALLLFGEIVPKRFARENRVRIARSMSLVILRLRNFLSIPVYLLTRGTEVVNRRMESLGTENASLEDLRDAIDLTVSEEESKEEKGILKGIINFGNTSVKNIMRSRVDVVALDADDSWEELVEVINKNKYSRLPVYDESLDNIKGILHIKSLLELLKDGKEEEKKSWPELAQDAYFVPESKKIDDLLEELKARRLHLAVVVDEYGGTAGIITLEDIVEEIFGDIQDESDDDSTAYRKIDDNAYIFEGRVPLKDVQRLVGLEEDVFEDVRGDSDSIGGLMLELNGKIPKKGEVLNYKNFEFHVEAASISRIIRVKFIINPEPLPEQ